MKKVKHACWNPFPETVPEKEGFYLVTVERAFLGKFIDPDRELRIGYWAFERFFANLSDEERVTAWIFAPMPYIKGLIE